MCTSFLSLLSNARAHTQLHARMHTDAHTYTVTQTVTQTTCSCWTYKRNTYIAKCDLGTLVTRPWHILSSSFYVKRTLPTERRSFSILLPTIRLHSSCHNSGMLIIYSCFVFNLLDLCKNCTYGGQHDLFAETQAFVHTLTHTHTRGQLSHPSLPSTYMNFVNHQPLLSHAVRPASSPPGNTDKDVHWVLVMFVNHPHSPWTARCLQDFWSLVSKPLHFLEEADVAVVHNVVDVNMVHSVIVSHQLLTCVTVVKYVLSERHRPTLTSNCFIF